MNEANTKKTALVSGATGFIGGNLCKVLIENGWEVHALVRSKSDVGLLKSLTGTVNIHRMQSNDTQSVIELVLSTKPNSIFHLAAMQLYDHKAVDIDGLLESNIRLGTQLLEGMCAFGRGVFINTGTYWQHYLGCEYDPVSLYAACKKAFQDIIVYYRNAKNIRATTLLLSDTYGENDIRKKIMALLIEASYTGEKMELTPGNQIIDLVHVDDVVDAYLNAYQVLSSSSQYEYSYSVSSGRQVSIRQLSRLIEAYTGKAINAKWGARSYPERQIMEMVEIEPRLPNWIAKVSLEEGIARVAQAFLY